MVFALLKSIERVVFPKYNCPVKDDRIELLEEHPDATCRNLILRDAQNVLVYKFDRSIKDFDGTTVGEAFPFLAPEPPIRWKCDYLIFHARKNIRTGHEKLYVIICNLKSKNRSNMGGQLKAGRILGEFILNTTIRCHDHWNSNEPGYVPLSSNELKTMIEWKEIAVMAAAPAQKGRSSWKKPMTEQMIECNKTYPFERLLA